MTEPGLCSWIVIPALRRLKQEDTGSRPAWATDCINKSSWAIKVQRVLQWSRTMAMEHWYNAKRFVQEGKKQSSLACWVSWLEAVWLHCDLEKSKLVKLSPGESWLFRRQIVSTQRLAFIKGGWVTLSSIVVMRNWFSQGLPSLSRPFHKDSR